MDKTIKGKIESGIEIQSTIEDFEMEAKISTGIIETVGASNNYLELDNKPRIETVELIGDKTFEELGARPVENSEIANML